MLTITNSSDSRLLSLYFFRLREPPYWMSFPVEVDSKLREGSMPSRVFICEQSTRNVCTYHTPNFYRWPTTEYSPVQLHTYLQFIDVMLINLFKSITASKLFKILYMHQLYLGCQSPIIPCLKVSIDMGRHLVLDCSNNPYIITVVFLQF